MSYQAWDSVWLVVFPASSAVYLCSPSGTMFPASEDASAAAAGAGVWSSAKADGIASEERMTAVVTAAIAPLRGGREVFMVGTFLVVRDRARPQCATSARGLTV